MKGEWELFVGNVELYGIIYLIENTINGKCYVGQTINGFEKRYPMPGKGIERVYKYHNYARAVDRNYNSHLLNSIEKYGKEKFVVIEILDIAYSREELDEKEIQYIKLNNSYKNGYNDTPGGSGVVDCSKFNDEEYMNSLREMRRERITEYWEHEARKIVCLETRKVYDNTRKASIEEGIPYNSLWNVCNGKYKTANNYHWSYLDELENFEDLNCLDFDNIYI